MRATSVIRFPLVLVMAGLVLTVSAQQPTAPVGASARGGAASGGAAAGQGDAREPQAPLPDNYMPRGFRPAPNAAPGMRVTDMGKAGHTYKINLTKGDDIMSALVEFAEKYQIRNAHFVGVGAIDKGMFGWADTERGNGQKKIPLTKEAEIVSLVGAITRNAQGQATVHGHGSVALEDGTVVGGHWFEARVSIIAEIYVTEEEGVADAPK